MEIKEGSKTWLYVERAEDHVCKAEILHVLPHPEDADNKLIVFRWQDKGWEYGMTTLSYQEMYSSLKEKILAKTERIEL